MRIIFPGGGRGVDGPVGSYLSVPVCLTINADLGEAAPWLLREYSPAWHVFVGLACARYRVLAGTC